MSETQDEVRDFLNGARFAVVGASKDRSKYGNKVLRAYQQAGKTVYPVHPKESEIEGETVYADLAALPESVDGISIITPPAVTESIVRQAVDAGIERVWMQPGAESEAAIQAAKDAGLHVIAGGPCLLVAVGYRE